MLSDNIISERLILRNVTKDYARDVWEIWSNPKNEKYMGDPVESLKEVMTICKKREKGKGNGFLTVAILKDTDEVIGTCCFGPTNKKGEWGLGYSIREEFWGKGYATEIAKSVITFGYKLGITKFVSECAIENVASGRVLEKCGMNIVNKSSFKQPKTNIIYESHVYMLHID